MKYSLFFLISLFSIQVFACVSNGINLNTDKPINNDVIDQNSQIVYTFQTDGDYSDTSFPKVNIVNENGFECEVVELKRTDVSYNNNSSSVKRCYKMTVEWSPGADLSGCTMTVDALGLQKEFKLFMVY